MHRQQGTMQQQQQQQQQDAHAERPYRSHLRPACTPCRKRKSRCQTETGSDRCVTCRAHGTPCSFPETSRSSKSPGPIRRQRRNTGRNPVPDSSIQPSRHDRAVAPIKPSYASGFPSPQEPAASDPRPRNPAMDRHHLIQDEEHSSVALDSADDHQLNMHIVGPAVTDDNQVLSDYLSSIPGATRSTRMIIPVAESRSRPVLFTKVQKRPLGVTVKRTPSEEKLEIIEKILEPFTDELIDIYFCKVNSCFPLLDEASFRHQYYEDKARISPSLLACLYAHTMVYWQHSQALAKRRCPDSRYIWNLANEAFYSDLHLQPGMSIIKAALLNVGGRPTTSLIGNGVLLGSAVSMANSLGLNHNPLAWDIPRSEKYLRMKIWWSLLVHDRWASLSHGTPPRLSRTQYDVPPPEPEYLNGATAAESPKQSALVFIALVSLSEVLDQYLDYMYCVDKSRRGGTTKLETSLNNWIDSLRHNVRHIIVRGTHLDIPGASNLRLSYLTMRLLLQRIELEVDKQAHDTNNERLQNRYATARRTAEDILMLTQEFQPQHLGDFWMPVSSFAFPATVSFLLRCTVETGKSPVEFAESASFRIARDLLNTLQSHQRNFGWDLGDLCLAQHAEIVDKIEAGLPSDTQNGNGGIDLQDFVMPDASLIDQLQFFPHIWDPLQNAF